MIKLLDAAEMVVAIRRQRPGTGAGSSRSRRRARLHDMQERLRRCRWTAPPCGHRPRPAHALTRFQVPHTESLRADDQKAKMANDIDQMEEMISARRSTTCARRQPHGRTDALELSLLESPCDEMAETGIRPKSSPGEKAVLEGDPTALRRRALNLLKNAVKFGVSGAPRVCPAICIQRLRGRSTTTAQAFRLDREKVFEPFIAASRQQPPDRRHRPGLAVVRSIACAATSTWSTGSAWRIDGASAAAALGSVPARPAQL